MNDNMLDYLQVGCSNFLERCCYQVARQPEQNPGSYNKKQINVLIFPKMSNNP